MQKRSTSIIIAVVGVLALGTVAVVAGPVIYRDFIAATPAPEPVLLSANESQIDGNRSTGDAGESTAGEPLDTALLSGTWVISEGSTAGYRVDEVLRGTEVTVTGRTSGVSGTLEVDGLTLERASFEVDVASIATDQASRDSYFREQAIDTRAHPTATFTLTAPVTATSAPIAGEVTEHDLTGDLTIAGVTQPVGFTVQLRASETTVEIAGQIPITFADFGVIAPSLGFVSVEPTGFVEFSLVATHA